MSLSKKGFIFSFHVIKIWNEELFFPKHTCNHYTVFALSKSTLDLTRHMSAAWSSG